MYAVWLEPKTNKTAKNKGQLEDVVDAVEGCGGDATIWIEGGWMRQMSWSVRCQADFLGGLDL